MRRAGHEAVRDHVRLADASGESLSEAEEVLGAALRAAAEESSAGPDPLKDTRQRVPVWVALCYALALEDGTPAEKARGTELQEIAGRVAVRRSSQLDHEIGSVGGRAPQRRRQVLLAEFLRGLPSLVAVPRSRVLHVVGDPHEVLLPRVFARLPGLRYRFRPCR